MKFIDKIKRPFRKLFVKWRHRQDYADWRDNSELMNKIFHQSGLSDQTYSYAQHAIYTLQCYKNEEDPRNIIEDLKQNILDINQSHFGDDYSYRFVTWTKGLDSQGKFRHKTNLKADDITDHLAEIAVHFDDLADELNCHMRFMDMFDQNTMQITINPVYIWDYGYAGAVPDKKRNTPYGPNYSFGWISKEKFEMNVVEVMDLVKKGTHNKVMGLFSGIELNGLSAVDVSLKNPHNGQKAHLMRLSTLDN